MKYGRFIKEIQEKHDKTLGKVRYPTMSKARMAKLIRNQVERSFRDAKQD